MSTLLVAAVQMNSGPDVARNLAAASSLIERAAARGARLVALPENFALMTAAEEDKRAAAESIPEPGPAGEAANLKTGPIISAMADAARRTGTWLVLGGMPERAAGDAAGRVHNACVVPD